MLEIIYRDARFSDLTRIVEIYNATISLRMVTADTENVLVEVRQKWFAEHNSLKDLFWLLRMK